MKKLICAIGAFAFIIACDSATSGASDTVESTSKKEKTSTKSFECLMEFENDYSKLLSKEDMNDVFTIGTEDAEEDNREGSYGEYTYSWLSDRPNLEVEISGMKMKFPDRNKMGIALLSSYSSDLKDPISQFDIAYRALSDEEIEEMKARIAESDDADVREIGGEFADIRGEMAWQKVDDVGSSAWYKWDDTYGGELAVLAGYTTFYIRLKISADPNKNLEIAKELAKKVLEKC